MDEKLGNQEKCCMSLEQKISHIEDRVFEQNKLLQSSEKSSENLLEIIDKEIKVDIKSSKEELRKQREYKNRRACFVQFSTILLLLSPARPRPCDTQVLHDKDPSSARRSDAPFKVDSVAA